MATTLGPTPVGVRPPELIEPTHHRAHNLARWSLLVLTGVTGLAALYGGIGLMTTGLSMPDEWLEGTPFGSWVLPGLFLLLFVAGTQLAAFGLLVRDPPAADRAALFAGVVQMGWIVVQLLVIQRYFFLQPVMFVVGALEAALAGWRLRANHVPLRPHRATT